MPKKSKRPVGFHFGLEIDGAIKGYFTECSGLSSENEVKEYREGTDNESSPVRKLAGLVKYGNITLKRGFTKDTSLWTWRQQVEDRELGSMHREGSIVMYDHKDKELARWNISRAWPSKISYLPPQPGSYEMGSEELVIVIESIRRVG